MKNIITYLWAVLLLGTLTAILGSMGNFEIAAFIICYCFWGGMLMPMLATEE